MRKLLALATVLFFAFPVVADAYRAQQVFDQKIVNATANVTSSVLKREQFRVVGYNIKCVSATTAPDVKVLCKVGDTQTTVDGACTADIHAGVTAETWVPVNTAAAIEQPTRWVQYTLDGQGTNDPDTVCDMWVFWERTP
jgi:hypothetical protein